MTYSLKCSPTVEAVWNALPQPVSERLTLAIARVCEDPMDGTKPWGIDDGVTRILALNGVVAALYLHHAEKALHVYQIEYLG
jgi:hypothetical protein